MDFDDRGSKHDKASKKRKNIGGGGGKTSSHSGLQFQKKVPKFLESFYSGEKRKQEKKDAILNARERPDQEDELPQIANLEDFISKKGGDEAQVSAEVAKSLGFKVDKEKSPGDTKDKDKQKNKKSRSRSPDVSSKKKSTSEKESRKEKKKDIGKTKGSDETKDEFGRDIASADDGEKKGNETKEKEQTKQDQALVQKLLAEVDKKRAREKLIQDAKNKGGAREESTKADEEEIATGKHVYRPKKKIIPTNDKGKVKDKKKKKKKKHTGLSFNMDEEG